MVRGKYRTFFLINGLLEICEKIFNLNQKYKFIFLVIFNAESNLNNYADLRSAFGNDHTLAKKHYVESGFSEGRLF